jgi:hypothetical protein
MVVWCIVLLILGILSILDTIFDYGSLFRTADSVLFMLVSLGILFRVKILSRQRRREQLEQNNDRLRERMMEIRNSLYAIKNGEPIEEVLKDYKQLEDAVLNRPDNR